jgi:signal transduction histidine kinase
LIVQEKLLTATASVLEKFGLHAGIEELCLEFSSSRAVEVQYENKTNFDIADNDRHLHVFRILQELMNNSLRHGKASISIVIEDIQVKVYLQG